MKTSDDKHLMCLAVLPLCFIVHPSQIRLHIGICGWKKCNEILKPAFIFRTHITKSASDNEALGEFSQYDTHLY